MNKMRNAVSLCCLTGIFIVACNSNTGNHHTTKERNKTVTERKHKAREAKAEAVDVNKPVAVFKQNMDDRVTDNDFIVKIYPTLKLEQFKMVIQYGGNTANDEVDMLPKKYYQKIALRKGETNRECVMGFIDTEGKFNKMTLITASGTRISIKKLKAYYISTE